ncbi:MAG TPA: hypothetical protein PKC43_07355 [Phycisphaerales bacterium]|nr:hypothetical protein [Phycisphaerales bacterium]HMP37252.1 hypothetical protein [Phycisphaerales bacterium]
MSSSIPSSIRSDHLLTLADLSPEEFRGLLRRAEHLKAIHRQGRPGGSPRPLLGQSVVLLFEKDSLRTRCSFEVGVHRLGGHAMYMDHARQRIGVRESVADYARNLDRFFAIVVARVYRHETVAALAAASSVPVINALCDRHHPCQALADFLTLLERVPRVRAAGGDLSVARLCYIGEANNVSNSLLHGAALAGATMTIVTPEEHGTDEAIWREAAAIAERTGARLRASNDPAAVADHDAIYTDTWFSMGFSMGLSMGSSTGSSMGSASGTAPDEAAARADRLRRFAPYKVDAAMMARAGAEAIFLHCLPAGRGVEVTDEVMDAPQSAIFDQAENRLWAQNALMEALAMRFAAPRSP